MRGRADGHRWHGPSTTRAQAWVTATFMVGALLVVLTTVLSSFVPSPRWLRSGSLIAGSLTAMALLWAVVAFRAGKLRSVPVSRTRWWASFALVTLAFFGMVWVVVVHGLPSVYTRLFGREAEIASTLEGDSGKPTCRYRLVGEALEGTLRPHMCISEEQFPGDGNRIAVQLQGRETDFGFFITSVHRK